LLADTSLSPQQNIDYELRGLSSLSESEANGLSLLAQVAAAKQRRCPNPNAPILFGTHKTENIVTVTKAPCKNWSCPVCGMKKTGQAVATLLNHVNTVGGQWYIMTLTAHENWHTPDASVKNFRANWDKLRKRIIRKTPDGQFSYFATWEHHEDGSFHKHLITNAKLPFTAKKVDGKIKYTCQWLKDNARQCGLGFMADYQPIQNAGSAAHYVAKYLTKSMSSEKYWPEKMHRYHTSQDWTPLPDLAGSSDFTWEYMDDADDLWLSLHTAKDNGAKIYGAYQQLSDITQVMLWYYEVRGIKRDHRTTPLYAPKPLYKSNTFRKKWMKGKTEHNYLM